MIKFVEISAPSSDFAKTLKKGIRVVVNMGSTKEPSYWMATVAKNNAAKGTVNLNFDDGDVAEYKAIKSKVGIVGIGVAKVRKTEIPLSQVGKWLTSEETKSPSSNLSDPVQKFLAKWVDSFDKDGANPSNKKYLLKTMKDLLPSIPEEYRKHTGSLFRGVRLPVEAVTSILAGSRLKFKDEFISYSSDRDAAVKFAAYVDYDKGKEQIGIVIKEASNSVAVNIFEVWDNISSKYKDIHSQSFVDEEKEVVLQNSNLGLATSQIDMLLISKGKIKSLGKQEPPGWNKFLKSSGILKDIYCIPNTKDNIKGVQEVLSLNTTTLMNPQKVSAVLTKLGFPKSNGETFRTLYLPDLELSIKASMVPQGILFETGKGWRFAKFEYKQVGIAEDEASAINLFNRIAKQR
ncbi:hypothetical protein Pori4_00009 [Pseudomonas phage vB_PpuM-Pori-4]